MGQIQEEKAYAYWLTAMPGMGSGRIHQLLELCGDAREAYCASEKLWRQIVSEKHYQAIQEAKRNWDVQGKYEQMLQEGISFVTEREEEYPGRLAGIPEPPYGLFYRGSLPVEQQPAVAVIGARDCSEYGRYVAGKMGRELGRNGIQVISGMARGVDGISQRGALEVGGQSFGVLGSGVDVCYPAGNRSLYEKLISEGGIISEYIPGTMARAQNFPLRNRIVSGLCDVLVVVEAREKSGTLITVDMALEQGREVYVVPGRITDRLSDGCNCLLKQGAGVLLSPGDLVRDLRERGVGGAGTASVGRMERGEFPEHLDRALLPIWQQLDYQPKSLEEIMEGLPASYTGTRVYLMLGELCMEKLARQITPGHFGLFS